MALLSLTEYTKISKASILYDYQGFPKLCGQFLVAAYPILLQLNIFIYRCRFVRREKGIEFINNVHLRDGCSDSTVSVLLINTILLK